MRLYGAITAIAFLLTNSAAFTQEDSSKVIFEEVESEAEYPGGLIAWRKFLEKNLNANVPIDNGAPVGIYQVMAQFMVDKNGNVKDIKMLTDIGYGMEAEVIRILKKSGLWTPARQNGRNVNAYRKQPVSFQVEQEDFDITTRVKYVLFNDTDNELIIDADNTKAEHLRVTISDGSIIKMDNGTFIARVKTKKERVVVTVYKTKGNTEKEVGAVSFEVKPRKAAP
jgi:hypothetical protein